ALPILKWNNDLGAKSIEGTTQKRPLILRNDVCQVTARNKVAMQFKPPHQRITLVVLDLVSLRQAAKTRAQAIAIARPNFRENPHPRDTGSVCYSFDHAGQQPFHIVEPSKYPRKTQRQPRCSRQPLHHRSYPSGRLHGRAIIRLFAQTTVLLHQSPMVEGTTEEGLR